MGYDVSEGHPAPEETPRLIRRWRWLRALWITVLSLIVLFVLAGTTTWVRDALAWPLTVHDELRPSDVIIVLGSGTRKEEPHLPPQAQQRVAEGIKLYNDHWASEIIMSGGLDTDTGQVEATEMLAYAQSLGFDPTVITPEGYSKDTAENAKDSLGIMAANGWKTALVVTSPYHTWRACRIFRKQGGDVRCASAPFSLVPANSFVEHMWDTRSVLREYVAIVYNWAKGEL